MAISGDKTAPTQEFQLNFDPRVSTTPYQCFGPPLLVRIWLTRISCSCFELDSTAESRRELVMATELSGCLVNGRYSVDKKIQSGYYGTTWLAIDKLQTREVCLKVCQAL